MSLAEEAVARGAMLLDRYVKDWHKKVNEAMLGGVFHMDDYDHCIAGVTEVWRMENRTPVLAFNGIVFSIYDDAGKLGFDISDGGSFDELQELWEIEVAKRLELDEFIKENDKSVPPPKEA
jgi:uncharacterized membrane protein